MKRVFKWIIKQFFKTSEIWEEVATDEIAKIESDFWKGFANRFKVLFFESLEYYALNDKEGFKEYIGVEMQGYWFLVLGAIESRIISNLHARNATDLQIKIVESSFDDLRDFTQRHLQELFEKENARVA